MQDAPGVWAKVCEDQREARGSSLARIFPSRGWEDQAQTLRLYLSIGVLIDTTLTKHLK